MAISSNKNEYQYTKMPWGKYKGRFLKEVPDDYIKWCIINWKDKGTAYMFVAEAERRKLI